MSSDRYNYQASIDKPVLSVRLPKELFRVLQTHIPWGFKNALFVLICEDLVKILKHPEQRIAFLTKAMKRDITLADFSSLVLPAPHESGEESEKESQND